jgi:hypothetical protein
MLVDNPRRFLKSLCQIRGTTFTAESYRTVLASLTDRGHVHEKTRDTYFYMATILKLIRQTSTPHEYTTTEVCGKICHAMDDPDQIQEYRRLLRGVLLTNPDKGALFKEFLGFISRRRSTREVIERFKEVPAKTLTSFCLEAGLAVEHGGFYKASRRNQKVGLAQFYATFSRVYNELQTSKDSRGPWIYVPVDLMRDVVSVELGLDSPMLFDELLGKLLDSKWGRSVFLHGAPPQLTEEFTGFLYRRKRYAYVSLRQSK